MMYGAKYHTELSINHTRGGGASEAQHRDRVHLPPDPTLYTLHSTQ